MLSSYITSFDISIFHSSKRRFCLLNSGYCLLSTNATESFSGMEFINGLLWSVSVHLNKAGMNIAVKTLLTDMICCFSGIPAISYLMSSIFSSCKNRFTCLGQRHCQIYCRPVLIMHKASLPLPLYLLLVAKLSLIYYLLNNFRLCRFYDNSTVGCFISEARFNPNSH